LKAEVFPLNLYARVRVFCAQLHARPRSETHRPWTLALMGIASLHPSYEIR